MLGEPLYDAASSSGGEEALQPAAPASRCTAQQKKLAGGAALSAAAVVAVVLAFLPGAAANTTSGRGGSTPSSARDPWPMFMRTSSHDASTGTGSAAAGPNLQGADLKAAWVYNMSHVVSSSPTLIGDVVLAASGCGPDPCGGGEIAAIYRSSGTAKWSTQLGSGVAYDLQGTHLQANPSIYPCFPVKLRILIYITH